MRIVIVLCVCVHLVSSCLPAPSEETTTAAHSTTTAGCYETVDVSVESWGTWPGPREWVGQYHRRQGTVNNKPVYEDQSGLWCIFYIDHWKVDSCDFLTPPRGSVGYLYTDIDKPCPDEVGPNWKFYPYSNVTTPATGGMIKHDPCANCDCTATTAAVTTAALTTTAAAAGRILQKREIAEENTYEEQIKTLIAKLEEAEARADAAESSLLKLQKNRGA